MLFFFFSFLLSVGRGNSYVLRQTLAVKGGGEKECVIVDGKQVAAALEMLSRYEHASATKHKYLYTDIYLYIYTYTSVSLRIFPHNVVCALLGRDNFIFM